MAKKSVVKKDQVVVNTKVDVICPSIFPGKRRGQMPLRCERGVGHEGVCQGGNHEWLMTEQEVLVTDALVEQLAHPPDQKGNVWR